MTASVSLRSCRSLLSSFVLWISASAPVVLIMLVRHDHLAAQDSGRSLSGEDQPAGQLGESFWNLRLHLTDSEYRAMQPANPQGAFGGPVPANRNSNEDSDSATDDAEDADRETVRNLMGIAFPWVRGTLDVTMGSSSQSALPCRVRYDGDFTYMMAGPSPHRPLYVELLDGHQIAGRTAFRLHTMMFDSSRIRERLATHVLDSFRVPVAYSTHGEVQIQVDRDQVEYLGLYTIQEAVDERFLQRHRWPETSLLVSFNGMNAFSQTTPNAFLPPLRFRDRPNQQQQERIAAFGELIRTANDQEFVDQLPGFTDVDAMLRYLAAQVVTSNVTGMSTIGTNDLFCLDDQGRFHFIATEMETAFGNARLSGNPSQLANLCIFQPYAGTCPLVERVLSHPDWERRYRTLISQSLDQFFSPAEIGPTIRTLETTISEAHSGEQAAVRERQAGGMGSGGLGSETLDTKTFVAQRFESLTDQLQNQRQGFQPALPNLGGFGGGPRRQASPEPISEDQFRDSVEVSDGFQATLFAKSPEVNYPVAISTEPGGAIYVASDEQGSLGTDRDGGKVLRCVDKDGDGVMDVVTTFCRAEHVRGVFYRSGSVWVSHPPFLSVFHDDDGDGVADRSRKLVQGLTTDLVNSRGGDHTTNGVRMGIDGWLYLGDGDYGIPGAVGTDGATVVHRGGAVVRVRPDGTELELFATGLRNPFDLAIDPYLNIFTRDNTNDGGGWDTRVSQIFQSAEYGYPRLFANFSDEIMPPLGTFGNGGGTGSLYIEDDSWPPAYNRSLFTGDWGRSGVFHHPLQTQGATFSLTQESFAAIPRATGMDLDVHGNLYVASWWSGEASVYVGPHVGFITRITPVDAGPRETLELESASIPQLLRLLGSDKAVVRFHTQGELIRRQNESVPALQECCQDRQIPTVTRVAALFALKQIQGNSSHSLLKQLTADAALREFALRALTDRKSERAELDTEFLASFLSDESDRVRAQAIISLGRWGDARVADQLLPLAMQQHLTRPDPATPNPDQVIPHLAFRALVQLDAVGPCLDALDGPYRTAALRALRDLHSPQAVEGLLAALDREKDATRQHQILVTLIRLHSRETPYDGSWWGIRPDTTGPFYDPTQWEQSQRIAVRLQQAMQENPTQRDALLMELKRHQVVLAGDDSELAHTTVDDSQPIEIPPVDPANPDQIGNLDYGEVVDRTLKLSGDPVAGQELFQSRSCSACHTHQEGQTPVGPHLAEIGKRYQASELIESVLRPGEKIAQGYETQLFLLTDGRTVSGFVIREKGQEITVRDSQGKTYRIPRQEIEQRQRQKQSAMPEGMAGSMTANQLADLIAYLKSL